jgi:putative ABC transport system ATP-binding protein
MTTEAVPAVLELRGVGKTYGQGPTAVVALDRIDLSVSAGELLAVTGRSGSGKSTLLNVAGGLDSVTDGAVVVAGTDLASLRPRALATVRRQRIGFVFQQGNLLPTLTALENVALPLELDGMAPRRAHEEARAALLDVLPEDIMHRYPQELSGGQQQQIAIARGLVGRRELLLADEPTGALDELTGETVLRLLRARADEGAAVVMATHDATCAGWADRVVRLRDGRLEMAVGAEVAS